MTPADIRALADHLEAREILKVPLTMGPDGLATLRAFADLVEASKEEHRDHRIVCMVCQALARVEALKP